MLSLSCRRAFLACAASGVLAHSIVRCSAYPREEIASLSNEEAQEQLPPVVPAVGKLPQQLWGQTLPEGKNLSTQVAPLNHENQVGGPAQIDVASEARGQNEKRPLGDTSLPKSASRRLQSQEENEHPEVFLKYPFKAAVRRRLDGPLTSVVEGQEILSEHVIPHGQAPPRRLQLLGGLSQLGDPFGAITSLFSGGLSARDKDQLETFARRVGTSRERVYRDLLFATGARLSGMDEFAMKQLVAKVGLENMASGSVPSNVQLSRQESTVLEAARRSRFQVERILATYEREVAQHAKALRQELQGDANQQVIKARVKSIVSDGLFKAHVVDVRRLQQNPRLRSLAGLLQGSGLLGTAGSLLRSIDPSNLSDSLNAGLSGLGLHHLHLTNIGGLGSGLSTRSQPLVHPSDLNTLQEALQSIFPLPQQVAALAAPLRSFQQGVSTSTDGAIGAFLSKEGLQPFLSIEIAKRLLGGLIGGEPVAPGGVSGWEDLGLSPAAASGLASVMPFERFLTKLGGLAQEVDADVGMLKRETRRRIGAQGFQLLPDQLRQLDGLLDRLVWGSLQAPQRRLQQIEAAESMPPQQQAEQKQRPQQQQLQPQLQHQQAGDVQQQPQQQHYHHHQQAGDGQQQSQQHAGDVQQQLQPQVQQQAGDVQQQLQQQEQQQPGDVQQQLQQQEQQQAGDVQQQLQPQAQQQAGDVQQPQQQQSGDAQPPADHEHQKDAATSEADGEDMESLFEVLLGGEDWGELDPDEEMDSAMQRVELLADAITVLLREYERAVEHLQKLLEDQIDAAEDIRSELEGHVNGLKTQVQEAQQNQENQQQKQEGAAAAAAAEVAKVYDGAMESLKGSLEELLQQEQQQHAVPPAVQRQLKALTSKIQAAAEERLGFRVPAH